MFLKGKDGNLFALGSIINIFDGNDLISYYEHMPMRGFQSSMGYQIVLGVGNRSQVDVELYWPDGKRSFYEDLPTDSLHKLEITIAQSVQDEQSLDIKDPIFVSETKEGLPIHRENTFVDFNSSHLVYRMRSRSGPAFAYDELSNLIYVGGATRTDPQLIQIVSGRMIPELMRGLIQNQSLKIPMPFSSMPMGMGIRISMLAQEDQNTEQMHRL